eukprot:Filipodium_phascolosomae@DN2965_c0_g1_i1.p1
MVEQQLHALSTIPPILPTASGSPNSNSHMLREKHSCLTSFSQFLQTCSTHSCLSFNACIFNKSFPLLHHLLGILGGAWWNIAAARAASEAIFVWLLGIFAHYQISSSSIPLN